MMRGRTVFGLISLFASPLRTGHVDRRPLKARRRQALLLSAASILAAGPVLAQQLPPLKPVQSSFVSPTAEGMDVPAWPRAPSAPANAPNVLVILTDDIGFGTSSTFGGPVPTPTLDALARSGVRYNAFHTTALC